MFGSEAMSGWMWCRGLLKLGGAAVCLLVVWAASAGEPAKINPFGAPQEERDDAVFGYVELSDGTVFAGRVYLTRDKRLKIYDEQVKRQREIPLRVVKQIECTVKKEWMEKEWRFKEAALNEKVYTGRSYPAREYVHTITLKDGRTIGGPLSEIVYVQPLGESAGAGRPQEPPQRFLLNKRNKGEVGSDLKSLGFVRLVKLGDEALEEGRRKAKAQVSPSEGKGIPSE